MHLTFEFCITILVREFASCLELINTFSLHFNHGNWGTKCNLKLNVENIRITGRCCLGYNDMPTGKGVA